MKKSALFLVLACLASGVFAGKGLVVTQKYTTETVGQSISVTWYVTDTKCKMKMQYSDKDINGTTTYFIPDVAAGKLLTYSDGPVPANSVKAYFTIPVQNIKSSNSIMLTVEKTGEVKDINGFKCEKVIAKSAGSITEMWVTVDFKADCTKFAAFFKNSYELNALNQGKITGFPVSSVTKDASGNVISSTEVLSVSSSEISDGEFSVPADYKSAEELSKAKK